MIQVQVWLGGRVIVKFMGDLDQGYGRPGSCGLEYVG